MDTKNIIAAISLSAAVIIIYGLFFAPTSQDVKKIKDDKSILVQNSEAPKLDTVENIVELSREEALDKTERIEFENENIKGSISLVGGVIDDLIFKKYTKSLESTEKVIFLNPKSLKNGFFVETGWVTNNKNINLPNSKTLWKPENNTKLSVNNPIKLLWTNDQGISFEKKISIDDKYLFTIDQTITNQSNNSYNFYPYGQIIRNETPEVTGFYILHEGLIGVFNDQLIEEDYKDIIKKNSSFNSTNGWLGITDKYFAATIIPESNKEFRSDFDFKDRFRASFIYNKSTEVGANESKTDKIKVVIPAKEVEIIDGYAEAQNINKYDLVIDFGWFYFIVKPLFFAIQYFFEVTGNFGLAIILITICIRLAFFPLANMSFRSMAKMKVLQPEMTRLKELHKDDKMKLQQAMMALYKKEKVNPLSGCLPILLQIPFFFAIYKMLYISIEMRHQPFYGWIKDLSDRDPTTIFNLFGLIPWDPPSFLMIGALPCLMGITMYLQQKLNPTPPDPVQAKIFMFFPLFLTVILAPFASGLVLYWTANNILTMAQQVVIMRRTTVRTVQKN
tara:strand:+ start:470 stop:2155 length:1686 start_codon:yes stop_codon:yes gene_type:complete